MASAAAAKYTGSGYSACSASDLGELDRTYVAGLDRARRELDLVVATPLRQMQFPTTGKRAVDRDGRRLHVGEGRERSLASAHELAIMGVADVLERFGWPTRASAPSGPNGAWQLAYLDLAHPTADCEISKSP